MIKLLKVGFWFGLVLYFLPLGEETKAPLREFSTVDAIIAANNAADEIGAFCSRRPDLCEAGGDALEQAAAVLPERFGPARPQPPENPEGQLTVEDIIAAEGENAPRP